MALGRLLPPYLAGPDVAETWELAQREGAGPPIWSIIAKCLSLDVEQARASEVICTRTGAATRWKGFRAKSKKKPTEDQEQVKAAMSLVHSALTVPGCGEEDLVDSRRIERRVARLARQVSGGTHGL